MKKGDFRGRGALGAIVATLGLGSCLACYPAIARTTVMVNAIGPVGSELYLANADGTNERRLSPPSSFDYDASFSADGKWVVFTSERDGSADVYRMRPDGSMVERLTDDPGFDDQGALSPDGRSLAFVSTREGGAANIWIKDLQSGAYRNLTGSLPDLGGSHKGFFRPAWSPDGKWLVFSSDRGSSWEPHAIPAPGWEHIQRASVYLLGIDGTGLRRLSDGVEYAGSPKFSADGKQVVYYATVPEQTFAARIVGMGIGDLEAKNLFSRIKVVDLATGLRTPVSSLPGLNTSPQFIGPDKIGYLRKGPGFESGTIAYTEANKAAEITTGPAKGDLRNPAWSPDGSTVIYQKFRYGLKQGQPIWSIDKDIDLRFSGELPNANKQGKVAYTPFPHDPSESMHVPLMTANPDGTDAKVIYRPKDGAVMWPSWSPDEKSIMVSYGVLDLNAPWKLLLVDLDGKELGTYGEPGVSSAFPSFAPDGRHVVYRVKGETQGLRILDLEDGKSRVLTTQADNFPAYSPDGSKVCFTRFTGGESAYDIFTVNADGTGETKVTAFGGNDAHCSWTPDSKRIIYSSSHLGYKDEAPLYDRGLAQPYAELFISDLDGGNQRQLTDDKWEQATPAVIAGTRP